MRRAAEERARREEEEAAKWMGQISVEEQGEGEWGGRLRRGVAWRGSRPRAAWTLCPCDMLADGAAAIAPEAAAAAAGGGAAVARVASPYDDVEPGPGHDLPLPPVCEPPLIRLRFAWTANPCPLGFDVPQDGLPSTTSLTNHGCKPPSINTHLHRRRRVGCGG